MGKFLWDSGYQMLVVQRSGAFAEAEIPGNTNSICSLSQTRKLARELLAEHAELCPLLLFLQQLITCLSGEIDCFFNFALKLWNSCHKNKNCIWSLRVRSPWILGILNRVVCFGARRWGQIMVSYLYLNFLIFVSLRKTLIIEMFNESGFFFHKSNFEIGNSRMEWIVTEFKKVSFIYYFLSDEKPVQEFNLYFHTKERLHTILFILSNILQYWKILTLAEVNQKKRIKDPIPHDIPRYFPQLLVTL